MIFPTLEPLTITTAKYNEEADIIILKLRDKSGKQYLTFSNYIPQKNILGFFETVINNNTFLHPALRAEITQYNEKEVAAIKSRTIFVGIQTGKVYDALGEPNKWEVSSEKATEVMVYSNGKLRVYIDKATGRVVDIQDNR
jgi:hypothetical protein